MHLETQKKEYTDKQISSFKKKQRDLFFKNRLDNVKTKGLYLTKAEEGQLWNLFLGGEHEEYRQRHSKREISTEMEKLKEKPIDDHIQIVVFFDSCKWTWSSVWKEFQLEKILSFTSRIALNSPEIKSSKEGRHKNAIEFLEYELNLELPGGV